MANFESAFLLTMGHEGFYANDPDDNGGETYMGIARKFFPKWSGWILIDEYKKKFPEGAFESRLNKDANLYSKVKDFYKANFWDPMKLDQVSHQRTAEELFDTGVNQGMGQAKLFLQEALNLCNLAGKLYANLAVDGQVGPVTIAALNNHPKPERVLATINLLQGEKYLKIVRNNESQEKFWGSWLSRVLVNPPNYN